MLHTYLYIVCFHHESDSDSAVKVAKLISTPYPHTMMQKRATQYLKQTIVLSNHVSADAYVHLLQTAVVHCCGTYLQ